ncbi:hypothetical protein O1Q79_02061 [Lonepinella sp. MS14434]
MVFMDLHTKKVIYHQIVKTEKSVYYAVAINKFREKGYVIQSITCDGKGGLLKDIFNTPIQLCQFHQVAIVTRKLTMNLKSEAGKAFKGLVTQLKSSLKNEFYRELHDWYLKYKEYINERSEYPNEKGYYPFKHRKLRSAYRSLLRHQDYLFTFEKYPELNMDKTTNRIENLFGKLKGKLIVHHGLSKKNNIMFIKDFLNNS